MGKMKKIVAIVLGATMLFGSAIAVHAATDYTICMGMGGACMKKMDQIYPVGTTCSNPDCNAPVYFYRCPDYTVGGLHAGRAACTRGHLN